MRGLALFIAGTLVGLAATSAAQNQSPNHGIVGLNHVALSVPDIDKAIEYYTKTMGFPEAFRLEESGGATATGLCADQPKHVHRAATRERPTAARHQPLRPARREHGRGDGDVQGAGRRRRRDKRQRHQGHPVQYRRPQRHSHGTRRTPARVASPAGDGALAVERPCHRAPGFPIPVELPSGRRRPTDGRPTYITAACSTANDNALNQPQPLQARVPLLADDDVVVHRDAEGFATSMICWVIWMSARDGVGSPEGWLCTRITAVADSSSARLTTSRG